MSETFKGITIEFVEGAPEPGAATINQTPTANPAPGKTWSELIRCPECKTDQWAMIEQGYGVPFARYIHDCQNCGHVILESEWNRVSDAGGELEQAKARIAELEAHIQTATKAIETRDWAIAELEQARKRIAELEGQCELERLSKQHFMNALRSAEALIVEHGDPFRGDDWQVVQDIRAALAQGAEKEGES